MFLLLLWYSLKVARSKVNDTKMPIVMWFTLSEDQNVQISGAAAPAVSCTALRIFLLPLSTRRRLCGPSFCQSVCEQGYWKSSQRISLKLVVLFGHTNRKNRLTFGIRCGQDNEYSTFWEKSGKHPDHSLNFGFGGGLHSQPRQSCLDSPPHSLVSSSLLSSPFSSSITPSLFHSRLKTYLFNKSFPP